MAKNAFRNNAKKTGCAALLLCVLLFSGCSTLGQNVNDMLRAPALGQGQGEIQKALAQAIGEEPQYIFPKEGEQRGPLLLADLDGDGSEEGVLLYTYSSSTALAKNKSSNVHVAIMRQIDGVWSLHQEIRGLSTDVASIEAADLLGNGNMQLVIGYGTSNMADKVLGLYECKNDTYALLYQSPYARCELADFTGRGKTDLLLATPYDQAAGMQLVYIPVQNGVFTTPQLIQLDTSFVSCAGLHPSRAAPVSAGGEVPGRVVVVDGVLSTGVLASQLVYYGSNGFYSLDDSGALRGQSARTSALLCARDVNNDGFVEIPLSIENSRMANSGRGVSFVEWADFINVSKSGEALVREWGILDSERSVYVRLPDSWRDQITVVDSDGSGEWQVLRASTLETLLTMRQVPASMAVPDGAMAVPATVNAYLVVQYPVSEHDRDILRMESLAK